MTEEQNILKNSLDELQPKEHDQLLESIQANILRFHRRSYANVLFVSFKTGAAPQDLRQNVAAVAERVTSAKEQYDNIGPDSGGRNSAKAIGNPSNKAPFRMLALSWAGYERLGLTEFVPADQYFQQGMRQPHRARYGELWNPHVEDWGKNYTKQIHLLILLADYDNSELLETTKDVAAEVEAFGEVVAYESLRRKIREDVDGRHPIEHFGFRDGISGPSFSKATGKNAKKEFLDQSPVENLGRVLVPEPRFDVVQDSDVAMSPTGPDGKTYGSFLTVLKLQQHVDEFINKTRELANRLGISHEEAQELCIGRRKNGQPLISHVDVSTRFREAPGALEPRPVTDEKDFNYTEDEHGLRCPFHAHIRKVNPRYFRSPEYRPVLARRGMPYSHSWRDSDLGSRTTASDAEVGLLFMSFQSEIREFVRVISRAHEPDTRAGFDPILGRRPEGIPVGDTYDQVWTTLEWDDGNGLTQTPKVSLTNVKFGISDVVTPRGGEYFFAPSVHFLRNLPNIRTIQSTPGARQAPDELAVSSCDSEHSLSKPARRKTGHLGRL